MVRTPMVTASRYGISMQYLSWTIRVPKRREGDRIAEIYQEAFGERSPGRPLRPLFRRDRTLVALDGEEIVGLLCVELADASLDTELACLEPLTRRLLAPIAGALPETETAAVEILAPPGITPVRRARDLVITAIAVDRRYRRLGVGHALAAVSVQRVFVERQIFAHCVAHSGSRQLFEGLGFLPLVHFARHYKDGTGMTLLYRPPCT